MEVSARLPPSPLDPTGWRKLENCRHCLWNRVRKPNFRLRLPLNSVPRVWLIETARTLPESAQLDGYDISSDPYPPKEWLPKNVHLGVLNMLDPVPKELVGKYDVVHVGLIVIVVRNENPGLVLKNLMTLLSTRQLAEPQDCFY